MTVKSNMSIEVIGAFYSICISPSLDHRPLLNQQISKLQPFSWKIDLTGLLLNYHDCPPQFLELNPYHLDDKNVISVKSTDANDDA